MDRDKATKVYINGRLIGFHDNAIKLNKELIKARREGRIDASVGIAFHKDTNEIYLNSDAGRVSRPLIAVENGKSKLTPDIVEKVKNKELGWNDLIRLGVVEYLDSEEEENSLIAIKEEELNEKHTHLEIDAISIFSVVSSMVPYINHDMAGKALHGAKMFKQALAIQGINYNLRTDTESFMLHYPEKNLVTTQTSELVGMDERPYVQNYVVAIMPWYGFNTMDALVVNRASIERGLGRASYFRVYEATEQRYPGGQRDKFEIPNEETVGFVEEHRFKKLNEDGIVRVEELVEEKDVIIGRTSPPRFLEEISEFGVVQEKRRDSSVYIRKGKPGWVDKVIITESEDGSKLAKIKIRTLLVPEVGDKIASKHGQKGIIAAIVDEEDMPFTADGVKPDLLLNPHSIPSRMTMGHMLEMLGGKAAALRGSFVDGTPFSGETKEELENVLETHGFNKSGKEVFYDGVTGEKLEGEIFTGVISYQRLFHLVTHKIQARARGPVQILTRQPTEGKEKEGGLRFGEMEGETLVGHGAAMLLHEKFIADSDRLVAMVSEKTGELGYKDNIRNRDAVPSNTPGRLYPVEISYGFKLLLDELTALGIRPKLNIVDKV